MAKIISVANQKGGVGKTITACTLAHGIALREGVRVLVVDLDPQGNVADSYGMQPDNDLVNLVDRQKRRWIGARENLWVTRSDRRTYNLLNVLAARDYREGVLVDAVHGIPFEVVIFDCAPSVSVLMTAALVASDWLIVPAQMEDFSIKGIGELLSSVAKSVNKGGHCQLAGVVPTFYDRRKKEHDEQVASLVEQFHELVWPFIPVDTKIPQANRYGETLWEAFPRSRALLGLPKYGGGYGSVLDRLADLIS